MSRSISIVAVLLLSAGVAWGDTRGEVVSYYAAVVHGDVIGTVPADGFVLTDIFVVKASDSELDLIQVVDAQEETKVRILIESSISRDGFYSLRSGIRFAGDSQIKLGVNVGSASPFPITLSGYIPCDTPCGLAGIIPAVGNSGLAAMVVLVLAAGAAVLNRRQRQAV